MWGKRDLLLVCGGATVSAFGNSVSLIVLLLHAQRISPLAVSGVLVASMVPVALGAPLAGLLVDRLRNRRLLIAALLLQGVALTGIAVFLDLLPVVVGLLVVQGCGQAVANPAASSLVPKIVGEDGATRGYSWLATGRTVGMLAGSAGGALLIATVGFRSALFVDAGTFLVEALALVPVRAERDPRGEPREHPSAGSHAMAGLAFVRTDRVLLVAVGGMAFAIGCIVLINVADPFYVVDVLHGDAVTMGLLQSCWVVGVLIGARLVGRIGSERGLVLALGFGGCVIGLAVCLPAAFPAVATTAVGWLFGGGANGVQGVAQQGLVRLRTPEALRGRVFAAASSLIITANLAGTVVSAGVVGLLGPRWAFAIGGMGALLAGAITLTTKKTEARTP
ncbi:MAG: MFS transporter [Umezawaea sp.]